MVKSKLKIWLVVTLLLAAAAWSVPASGVTHYVSEGESIQAAIDAAVDEDEIEVAPGTYLETVDFKGKAVRLYSRDGSEVTTIDGRFIVFEDNFDDGDYDGWQIVDEGNWSGPSEWSAASGAMVQSSNIYTEPTSDERYLGTYAVSPQSISRDRRVIILDMKSDDDDWMGVMFCYQDQNNYYRFAWNGTSGGSKLVKCRDGVFTTLASDSVSYVKGQTYRVEIRMGSSFMQVAIDNLYVLLGGNDGTLSGGRIGLYCCANEGTHFDNISVQAASSSFNIIQCVQGEGPETILEGFTITSSDTRNYPYGMYNQGSSPTVTDCVFRGVRLMSSGMYNWDSSPVITNCIFEDIEAETGGGIVNVNSSPTIANCMFSNNRPNAVDNIASDPNVTNCSFNARGQFYSRNGSDALVTGCTFAHVRMSNVDSSPIVTNCTFSLSYYSGMYNSNSSPTVLNCTFTRNSYDHWQAGAVGGGMYNGGSSTPTVTNCIFWDNGNDGIYDEDGSFTTVTYSNVEGGWPSEGNIDSWPFFVNSGGGDFRLGWHSPCIDAGDDAAIPAGIVTDLDGGPRRIDGDEDDIKVVDMGAYEYASGSLGTSLEISITSQDAVDAGAAWRLAGQESWLGPGETINNLLPGYYQVQFKELDGWFEPDSMWVCVIRDLPAAEPVEYRPVGAFDVGEIPPGEVSHGHTLAFNVYSEQLGPDASLTMSADPAPLGEITFVPETGLFVYRPDDEADVAPFEVTFTATLGAEAVEQTVEVTPVPDLPAEYTLVSSPVQAFPDAESRDYLFVNEVMSEADEVLNGIAKKVRSITISGKTVVFETGHANGLYESYNSAEGGPYIADIKEMTIYAETLIIGDRLHLPQTNLTIYARRIQFTEADAHISTTPYDARIIDPGQTVDGLDAGDITLYVESYIAEPDYGVRFTVVGTTGHNGGQTGEPGHLACTLDELQPLAWLSPYSVKMVLAHARDAYLYGYTAEARDILADYQNLLDACMGLPEWDTFDDQWQLEFEQMHGEVVTLLHRLESGLDYFGNPPGWVPMLSFEVSKAFYEQEIGRAVRVLYLSYWLQNKAESIADKAAGLEHSREEVWGQTQDFADQYGQIQTLIPKLKSDASRIAARIGRADSGECSGLLCDLKRKEESLIARADRIVEKQHEVPWWKKALKGLGTVVTSTITGAASGGQAGAAAGLVTGSITALSDEFLSEKDPWPAISSRTDTAKQFYSIDFAEMTGEWIDQFWEIPDDLDVVEQNGPGGYLQDLRAQAASMASGMHQVKESLKATSLSNAEVEAELKKIKAEDPIFNSLVDQITQLSVEKQIFNRQLTAAMQKVSTLANGITNNFLGIDAMNRDISHANGILDPRATMYVKDMERRALERLQKYHYYLGKSYEYRLLEPTPMDLNIHYIFTTMQGIVSADGLLDENGFGTLKTAYEEQLWDLTDQIYRDYQENESVEATAPVRLDLSSEQIADLNAGNTVTIHLKDAARFQYDEENIRIVDVEIEVMDYHVEGEYDDLDYFDFKIEHAGESKLQKDGQIYQFVHYKDIMQETNPINWNERHFADGFNKPVDQSDASESMLFSLLEDCLQAGTGDIMLYARPGAWADIVIEKVPYEENSGQLVIDAVRLLINYDYIIRPSHYSTLQILTEPQAVLPYFRVDTRDLWERKDGVGAFYRTYTTGSAVAVEAPEETGNYMFVTWTDGRGDDVTAGDRLLSIDNLDDNRKRIAKYEYVGPIPSAGDFNEDFFVDFSDMGGLSIAWLTEPGDANWESAYDISDPPDDVIDIRDLFVFVEEWLTMP